MKSPKLSPEGRRRKLYEFLRSDPEMDELTPREFDVLSLVCNGDYNKTIGQKLSISTGYVETCLNLIYSKLELTEDNSFPRVKAAIIYRERYPYEGVFKHSGIDSLAPRYYNALSLMAEGYSNAMIAEQLGISGKTVENYINRVYARLGIKGIIEAPRVIAMLMYGASKR